MSSESHIHSHVDDAVGVITIDRRERFNSFDVATARERTAVPEEDADLRVFVAVQTMDRVHERLDVLVTERIVLLGTIEGDVGDVLANVVPNGHDRPLRPRGLGDTSAFGVTRAHAT